MFAINEDADVYLAFDECEGNATVAVRVYTECYQVRRHPTVNEIRKLDARLRETGSLLFIPSFMIEVVLGPHVLQS